MKARLRLCPIFFAATARQLKDSSLAFLRHRKENAPAYIFQRNAKSSFMIEEHEIAYQRMMSQSKIGRNVLRTPA
jgi:hypothetical protein